MATNILNIKSRSMIMVMCNKQQRKLNSLEIKQNWDWVEKSVAYRKKRVLWLLVEHVPWLSNFNTNTPSFIYSKHWQLTSVTVLNNWWSSKVVDRSYKTLVKYAIFVNKIYKRAKEKESVSGSKKNLSNKLCATLKTSMQHTVWMGNLNLKS